MYYGISCLLDAFDARYFNQSTKFGSMLDQLTDRASSLFLNMTLYILYPKYSFFFQLSSVIDIISHWMYIWAGTMKGKTSHKSFDESQTQLLNLFYSSKPILFFLTTANEIFYGLIYVVYFDQGINVPFLNIGLYHLILLLTAPFSFLKTYINLLQLFYASLTVGKIDLNIRSKK